MTQSVRPERRCELCDLPFAQCVHGLELRKAKQARRRPKQKTAKTASKPDAAKVAERAEALIAKPIVKCAECGKQPRHSRYRLCLQCGERAGWLVCTICGRSFAPNAGQKKRRCKYCATQKSGKGKASSIWVVASAGSPGLGKRG